MSKQTVYKRETCEHLFPKGFSYEEGMDGLKKWVKDNQVYLESAYLRLDDTKTFRNSEISCKPYFDKSKDLYELTIETEVQDDEKGPIIYSVGVRMNKDQVRSLYSKLKSLVQEEIG